MSKDLNPGSPILPKLRFFYKIQCSKMADRLCPLYEKTCPLVQKVQLESMHALQKTGYLFAVAPIVGWGFVL